MTIQIHLVGGLAGGAGRSLTAALLAVGLHLHGRKVLLVRQTYDGAVTMLDPIESTLPLPCCTLMLPTPYVLPAELKAGMTAMIHQNAIASSPRCIVSPKRRWVTMTLTSSSICAAMSGRSMLSRSTKPP
jgi:hypothetical protein